MEKDSFIDTNVIINYVNYQKDKSKDIVTKCYLYVVNRKNKFIICHTVIRELSNILTKLTILHREVLKKIENEAYSMNKSKNLSNKDLPTAEKLYFAHKEINEKKLREIFSLERDIFEIEIERFLKNKVDIKIIPIEEIKIELVNALRDFIENYADCQILASALQYQKDRKIFLLVTADGKDFAPNNYDFLKNQFELNYPNEKYKFPELLNLMFEEV